MKNKDLLVQKLSSLLKEKENRIKIVIMGQEIIDIFERAQKKTTSILFETVLVESLARHLSAYALDSKHEKDLADDLITKSELILD